MPGDWISFKRKIIATYIETSIKCRFKKIFASEAAILASLTLPKFKLRWSNQDRYKQMLIEEIRIRCTDDVIGSEATQTESVKRTSSMILIQTKIVLLIVL